MRIGLIALIALVLVTTSGCVTSSWEQYPHSLYSVLKDENQQTILAHHALLGQLLEEARQNGWKPPAGIATEYAYYSVKVGRPELVEESLQVELLSYPESEAFLNVVREFFPAVEVVPLEPSEGALQ